MEKKIINPDKEREGETAQNEQFEENFANSSHSSSSPFYKIEIACYMNLLSFV